MESVTCPRCHRPNIGIQSDGRLKHHSKWGRPGRCPGSCRLPENAALRISPLKLLGLRGRMTSTERDTMRKDAVYLSSAIALLDFDGSRVLLAFRGGQRDYIWRCGPGGWSLLWKCYRQAARANGGRFSLGRAVNRWREMPSIKRAAAERQRQELAEESPNLMDKLKESLEVVVDPFALISATTTATRSGWSM